MRSRLPFLFLLWLSLWLPLAALANGPDLPGEPNLLREKKLPPSRFVAFPIAPLSDAKVVWLNLPALKELGFRTENGHTPELEADVIRAYGWVSVDDALAPGDIGPERRTAFADYYGGGGLEKNAGSARAGSFDDVQIKGIGKTPMLKSRDPNHTARSTVYEGMKDAIWGNFTHQELPYGGNRILALIDRNVGGEYGPEILEVREQPTRVAHFMRRREKTNRDDARRTSASLAYLAESLPRPAGFPEEEWSKLPREKKIQLGLREYANRVGRQQGHMHAWGIYHGTNSQSNIEINGRLLDFVTASTQPGQAPIGLLDDVLAFGHHQPQTRTALITNVLKDFETQNESVAREIRAAFPKGANEELLAVYDHAFRDQARRQALEKLGIPSHLVDGLIARHPAAADSLAQLADVTGKKAVNILERRVDSVPASRLTNAIKKIHQAESWTPASLRKAGLRVPAQPIAALLADAAAADPAVSSGRFRQLTALKADWNGRPNRSLYFDELRWLSSDIEYEYEQGIRSAVKDKIDSVEVLSQRKVDGLKPYEVPVSVRQTGDGFRKELTTFDGATGQWSKLFYADPAMGSTDFADRIWNESTLRPGQEIALEKIGPDLVARVPVKGPEEAVSLGLEAATKLAPAARPPLKLVTRDQTRCGTLFAGVSPGRINSFAYANGVLITGGDLYPLRTVRKNLGLGAQDLRDLSGKSVLSVGEGYSGLLPMLKRQGVKADGLDLWYGQKEFPANATGRAMEKYVRENGDSLIPGSALKMPVKNGAYDEVMSHMLVNNFNEAQGIAYFREALRVVKPGGLVRTAGVEPWMVDRYTKLLREEFGSGIKIEYRQTPSTWRARGETISQADYLLVVRKP